MNGIPSGQLSIWSAALMAAECRALSTQGSQYAVSWQPQPDSMRFVAPHDLEVLPFGVRLDAGDVLEVRWEPNETSYTLDVRSAQ